MASSTSSQMSPTAPPIAVKEHDSFDKKTNSRELGQPEKEFVSPGGTKRNVRFASRRSIMEDVKRISRLSNYSISEVIAVWGDTEEHKLHKKELKNAVKDMVTGRRMSDNLTFTSVGIDDKIGEGKCEKMQNRQDGWEAVFDEQYLQEEDGIKDDDILADVYHDATTESRIKAHAEALQLEEEVKNLVLSD